jgi:hypothetical protein
MRQRRRDRAVILTAKRAIASKTGILTTGWNRGPFVY